MGQRLKVKVPGKLMVAGEYAVLEPNQPLIVMAVNRFVYCTIESQTEGSLHLVDLGLDHVKWEFHDWEIFLNNEDPRLNFIKNALQLSLQFLQEKDRDFSVFSLTVRSELDDASGKKYGLGSSAAVVTAVISSVLKLFNKGVSKEVIFKLAAMAHTVTQQSGSGADIAASTFGGMMKYTSFQAEWLLKEMAEIQSVKTIVEKKWPYYSNQSLQLPKEVKLFVGWTGKPASTTNLVKEVRQLKETNLTAYDQFLHKSRTAVELIVKGMMEGDSQLFFEGITGNRHALAELGKIANVSIETEKLHQLSIVAEQLGGAGKLSGAGGGDCGLAFIPQNASESALYSQWMAAGIALLPITIYIHGVEEINA